MLLSRALSLCRGTPPIRASGVQTRQLSSGLRQAACLAVKLFLAFLRRASSGLTIDSDSVYAISSPRIVPVLEANLSDSMPKRWSTLTNRFGSG